MTSDKQLLALSLFQEEKDTALIAPLRNRHNYSLFNLNLEDNYDIALDYQNFSLVESGIKSGSITPITPTTSSGYSDTELLESIISTLNNHISDKTIHVTLEDKIKWDGYEDNMVVSGETLLF